MTNVIGKFAYEGLDCLGDFSVVNLIAVVNGLLSVLAYNFQHII